MNPIRNVKFVGLLTAASVAVLLPISFAWRAEERQKQQNEFVARWGRAFSSVAGATSTAHLLEENSREQSTLFISLKDGGWVAVASHCSHDPGGDWDQSVMIDCKRRLYVSDHHFCGEEGLHSELGAVRISDLNSFLTDSSALGFKAEEVK